VSAAVAQLYLLAGPNGAGKSTLYREAQQHSYGVVLLVVCLDEPGRLLPRVLGRVREGGHGVPAQRVLSRYPRTLQNLIHAVRLADLALLYDTGTTSPDDISPPLLVATCRGQKTTVLAPDLPAWARQVLQVGQMPNV